MAYWLMKSEPDTFSIDDLRREGVAGWDGVRNYQARNNLRSMKKGDSVLFYHSSVPRMRKRVVRASSIRNREGPVKPPAIVGLMEIVREAYPDATAPGEGWDQVNVKFRKKFPQPLSLDDIKTRTELSSLVLLKNSRLSVQPITAGQWRRLLKLLDK